MFLSSYQLHSYSFSRRSKFRVRKVKSFAHDHTISNDTAKTLALTLKPIYFLIFHFITGVEGEKKHCIDLMVFQSFQPRQSRGSDSANDLNTFKSESKSVEQQ